MCCWTAEQQQQLGCAAAAAGGKLSMAYDGSALNTMAQVKQQIMLNGGVLTAMATTSAFYNYNGLQPGEVFDGEIPEGAQPDWHAVFCFGWSDAADKPGEGYWMCKNRYIPYGAMTLIKPLNTLAAIPQTQRKTSFSCTQSTYQASYLHTAMVHNLLLHRTGHAVPAGDKQTKCMQPVGSLQRLIHNLYCV
jgi:hypothetical protein